MLSDEGSGTGVISILPETVNTLLMPQVGSAVTVRKRDDKC
jgi:hypothetical protein